MTGGENLRSVDRRHSCGICSCVVLNYCAGVYESICLVVILSMQESTIKSEAQSDSKTIITLIIGAAAVFKQIINLLSLYILCIYTPITVIKLDAVCLKL